MPCRTVMTKPSPRKSITSPVLTAWAPSWWPIVFSAMKSEFWYDSSLGRWWALTASSTASG